MHPADFGREARVGGADLAALVEDLECLREMTLLDQLVGDGDVLLRRLLPAALAGVQLGEPDPDLQVGGVDLRQPP